jgi:hypothetical protein
MIVKILFRARYLFAVRHYRSPKKFVIANLFAEVSRNKGCALRAM